MRVKAISIAFLLCCLIVLQCRNFGAAENASWDCPECGRTGITRNYCGGCGYPAPWIDGTAGKLSREDFSKVGSIVRFGHYDLDNNLNNGLEEIAWIVLDVQGGKSLLISKFGLDAEPYYTTLASVTWETCTLRSWLNSDFLETAFTAKEKSSIITTKVDNSKSQGYSVYNTDGGTNTLDQIFLLSYHEAFDLYFKNDDARKCCPTQHALARRAYTNNTIKVNGWNVGCWWLRSPAIIRAVPQS